LLFLDSSGPCRECRFFRRRAGLGVGLFLITVSVFPYDSGLSDTPLKGLARFRRKKTKISTNLQKKSFILSKTP